MFWSIVGWVVCLTFNLYLSFIAFLLVGDSFDEYDIGGRRNDLFNKSKAIIFAMVVILFWALLFTYGPFKFITVS